MLEHELRQAHRIDIIGELGPHRSVEVAMSWTGRRIGALVVGAATFVVVLGGCGSPCDPYEPLTDQTWHSHEDLAALGGTLCLVTEPAIPQGEASATFVYETSGDPADRITRHLESRGWRRSTEGIDEDSVAFEKAGEGRLSVHLIEEGEYTRALFVLTPLEL